jgi:hypothetical protein
VTNCFIKQLGCCLFAPETTQASYSHRSTSFPSSKRSSRLKIHVNRSQQRCPSSLVLLNTQELPNLLTLWVLLGGHAMSFGQCSWATPKDTKDSRPSSAQWWHLASFLPLSTIDRVLNETQLTLPPTPFLQGCCSRMHPRRRPICCGPRGRTTVCGCGCGMVCESGSCPLLLHRHVLRLEQAVESVVGHVLWSRRHR